jgi:lambda repressor-like predicted transcriptional regulator
MITTGPLSTDDIQRMLRKKGITQKQLAEKYGKSEMSISRVINFKMTSEPLMKAIAKEIGMSPEVVFAKYYNWPKRRPRRSARNL